MRTAVVFPVLIVGLLGCSPAATLPPGQVAHAGEGPADLGLVVGKTQPAPGHSAAIAPVVLHPVVEVLVRAGARVKKDQPLVKLDDDEPQADVRAKKANVAELRAGLERLKAEPRREEQKEGEAALENARVCAKAARELFARLEPLWKTGSIPEQRYHETRASLLRCEADEHAAQARLERLRKRPFEQELAELEARIVAAEEAVKGAEAELEHYTVTAGVDGVVAWLDVKPGTVSRPGTTLWGEIIDPSVLDVRCDLPPAQADRVRQGQPAEVLLEGRGDVAWKGTVALVGIAADPRTGKVPVLIRLETLEKPLRCYVDVKCRFLE